MSYIIIPGRRTRQPQGAVRISPTSQFLPGLRFSMPHPAVGDIVNGNQLTLGAGGSRVATAQGIAIAGNGSQACATIPLNMSGSYVMSASFWLKWDTFANDDDLAFELTADTNSNVGGLMLDPNAAAGTLQLYGLRSAGNGGGWECSRPSPGLHHYVVTLRQDVSYAVPGRVWIDGVEQTASRVIATTASFTAFANSTLYLMSRGGTSLFGAGAITGLTFWNDYFDEVKAKELYRYGGWSLYAPDPRRLYFGAGGGAGPSTYNVTYADSKSLTDAISNLVVFGVTYSDTKTLVDTITSNLTAVGGYSESISLSDSDTGDVGAATYTRDVEESITLTDSYTTQLTGVAAQTETIDLQETYTGSGIFGVAVTETISLTDNQVQDSAKLGDVTETISLSDAYSSQLVANSGYSDTIDLQDLYSSQAIFSSDITDSINLAEAYVSSIPGGSGDGTLTEETINQIADEVISRLYENPVRRL